MASEAKKDKPVFSREEASKMWKDYDKIYKRLLAEKRQGR